MKSEQRTLHTRARGLWHAPDNASDLPVQHGLETAVPFLAGGGQRDGDNPPIGVVRRLFHQPFFEELIHRAAGPSFVDAEPSAELCQSHSGCAPEFSENRALGSASTITCEGLALSPDVKSRYFAKE